MLAVFLLVLVAAEVFGHSLISSLDAPDDTTGQRLHDLVIHTLRDAVVALGCALYAFYRVWAFHPIFRPKYCQWLQSTPWTPGRQLPAGPIHWIPQDAGLLLPLALMLHGVLLPQRLAAAVVLSVSLHCLLVAGAALMGGVFWSPLAALAVLAVLIRLIPESYWALAPAGVLWLLDWLIVRQTLARYPWTDQPAVAELARLEEKRPGAVSPGYPLSELGPRAAEKTLSRPRRLAVIALAAWWLWCLGNLDDMHGPRPGTFPWPGAALLACAAVLIRVVRYQGLYWPPISLAGRLLTGRWIIPGYDRVLVAPVLAVAIALAPAGFGWLRGWREPAAWLTAMALSLAVSTCLGPSLETWRLTGHYRLAPLNLQKSELIKI